MAAQLGREFLLSVEDSPGGGTFTTVAGLRANTLTYNNEAVDVTTKDDDAIRKLLATAGTRSISISGEGVAQDEATLALIRASAAAGTHLNYQLESPGTTDNFTLEGAFMIESFELTGEYNNELGFSFTLQSDGTISES